MIRKEMLQDTLFEVGYYSVESPNLKLDELEKTLIREIISPLGLNLFANDGGISTIIKRIFKVADIKVEPKYVFATTDSFYDKLNGIFELEEELGEQKTAEKLADLYNKYGTGITNIDSDSENLFPFFDPDELYDFSEDTDCGITCVVFNDAIMMYALPENKEDDLIFKDELYLGTFSYIQLLTMALTEHQIKEFYYYYLGGPNNPIKPELLS